MKIFLMGLLLLLNIASTHATSQLSDWFSKPAGEQASIHVDLFLTSTCPHCHKADAFFLELEQKEPWLVVHRYFINQDKAALKKFYERLQQQHIDNFSVPTLFFCDSRWAGFADEGTTGKALLHALHYCRQKINEQGRLSDATIDVIQRLSVADQLETGMNIQLSASSLIPLLALTDALTPCAFFCFAAFLAFLSLYPARKWMQGFTGIVFILSLGVVHYLQQVHFASYYQTIANMRIIMGIVGILLLLYILGFCWMRFKSFILMGLGIVVAALTAVAVQVSQQTCLFNASLLLEQWLELQRFTPQKQLFYLLEYQIIYLLPMVLVLFCYLLFGQRNRTRPYQQMLTIAACTMLAIIGLVLVVNPVWLGSIWFSIIALLASLLIARSMRNRWFV